MPRCAALILAALLMSGGCGSSDSTGPTTTCVTHPAVGLGPERTVCQKD